MNQVIIPKTFRFILNLLCMFLLIPSCTPVKTSIAHQYTLAVPQYKTTSRTPMPYALLISKPEAMAGYQTNQMLYIKQPFELEPFAKNAWVSPPAAMLYPVLIKRFQESHAFRAITSSPYADKADYRLDTQLIELHQRFFNSHSTLLFMAKVTLTRISDNHVLVSKIIKKQIACEENTPYGGVLAANHATTLFVNDTLDFVIRQVQNDKGGQTNKNFVQ